MSTEHMRTRSGRRGAAIRIAAVLCAVSLLAVPPLSGADRAPPPIIEAARTGDVSAVRKMLADGADVDVAAGDGMTALHWAAYRGDSVLAAMLIRSKASVTSVTRLDQSTPLHVASRQGHGALVALLLRAGAKPDASTLGGATALHLAARAGDSVSVSALLKAGADANAEESEWNQTPLMFAAAFDRAAAIRALAIGGADPSRQSSVIDLTKRAAQEQAAARKRNAVMFSFLPKQQKDSILLAQTPAPAALPPRAPETTAGARTGAAPDRAAVARDSAAAAAASVVAAPDSTPVPRVYQPGSAAPPTEFLSAAQIQMAIDSGRVVFAADQGTGAVQSDTTDGQVAGFEGTVGGMGGLSALHHAVRQGNIDATLALLDIGADINQVSLTDSTTPLLMASINGHFDLAMILVKRGADVTIASTAGATPLYTTINSQWLPRSRFPQPQAIQVQKTTYLELMEAMIAKGADVNVRLKKNLWYFAFNNCGNANCGLEYLDNTTPFWRAAYAVDVEAMRMLKAHGAIDSLPSQRAVTARFQRPTGASAELGSAAGERLPSATGATAAAAAGATAGAQATAATVRTAATARTAAARADSATANTDAPRTRVLNLPPPPMQPGLDAATDSASKAVPAGVGVYPIHAAAGVGYGNGFAGNSHNHSPGGWMPAMRYLVEELGADVNQRDNNGLTPLHHAAARGDNEMILYLVSKGADVRAVSRRGQTTVDLANGPVQRLRPFPETIKLLESLGAKNSHKCVAC